jgi:hypothetical protein
MRFFTRGWHAGELSDAESDAVVKAYEQRLTSVLPRLPLAAHVLARGISIHDARIRRVVRDGQKSELLIEFRCGDRQVGYYDLDLRLHDARLTEPEATQLSEAAEDPQTQVLDAEIDVEDETPIYRILFWPYRECSIRFQDAEIRLSPQLGRDIAPADRRFLEIGSPADSPKASR